MDHDVRVKCCIVGDFGVGKTSLVYSWMNHPLDGIQSTLGIDFFSKMVFLGQRRVRVSLWDTAGAERFRSLMYSYLRDAQVIFVVYDRTNPNAMHTLTKWLRIVEQHAPTVVAVLGNKSDLSTATAHAVAETLEPYRRMRWELITGHVSSRRPETFSRMFKKCLVQICPEEDQTPPNLNTVRMAPRKRSRRTCCA